MSAPSTAPTRGHPRATVVFNTDADDVFANMPPIDHHADGGLHDDDDDDPFSLPRLDKIDPDNDMEEDVRPAALQPLSASQSAVDSDPFVAFGENPHGGDEELAEYHRRFQALRTDWEKVQRRRNSTLLHLDAVDKHRVRTADLPFGYEVDSAWEVLERVVSSCTCECKVHLGSMNLYRPTAGCSGDPRSPGLGKSAGAGDATAPSRFSSANRGPFYSEDRVEHRPLQEVIAHQIEKVKSAIEDQIVVVFRKNVWSQPHKDQRKKSSAMRRSRGGARRATLAETVVKMMRENAKKAALERGERPPSSSSDDDKTSTIISFDDKSNPDDSMAAIARVEIDSDMSSISDEEDAEEREAARMREYNRRHVLGANRSILSDTVGPHRKSLESDPKHGGVPAELRYVGETLVNVDESGIRRVKFTGGVVAHPTRVSYCSTALAALLEAIRHRMHADHVLFFMSTACAMRSSFSSQAGGQVATPAHTRGSVTSVTSDPQRMPSSPGAGQLPSHIMPLPPAGAKDGDVSLRLVATSPVSDLGVIEVPHSRGIAGIVYTSGVGVNVTAQTATDLIVGDAVMQKITDIPVYSALVLPLAGMGSNSRCNGVIQVVRCAPRPSSGPAPEPFTSSDELALMRFNEFVTTFMYMHGTETFRQSLPMCMYPAAPEITTCRVPQARIFADLILSPRFGSDPDIASVSANVTTASSRPVIYRGGAGAEAHRGAIMRRGHHVTPLSDNPSTFIAVTDHIAALELMWKELFDENTKMHQSCREWQLHMAQLTGEVVALKNLIMDARQCNTTESMKRVLGQNVDTIAREEGVQHARRQHFGIPGVRTYSSDLSIQEKKTNSTRPTLDDAKKRQQQQQLSGESSSNNSVTKSIKGSSAELPKTLASLMVTEQEKLRNESLSGSAATPRRGSPPKGLHLPNMPANPRGSTAQYYNVKSVQSRMDRLSKVLPKSVQPGGGSTVGGFFGAAVPVRHTLQRNFRSLRIPAPPGEKQQ
eukprot:PhM_4_TR1725/c0_g1_i1/m.30578